MLPNSVALRRIFRAMFSQQRSAAPGRIPPSALARSRHTAYFVLVAAVVLFACAREPVAPTERVPAVTAKGVRATVQSVVAVAALLDSFSIGGVYTVLPRGGYAGGMSYARSPEKDVYAGRINNHPTGLVFPVGLPIRVLADGRLMSRSTPAFQAEYCWRHGAWDPICSVSAVEYTVHGSAPWYEGGTGLSLTWWRSASYYDRFYGLYPNAEFFRWRVPSADTLSRRELHFNRMGCCYYIPWGTTAAWETYEGVWRFGAVPDDGGQAELGFPPLLRLRGPRTDAPRAAPATFTVEATPGESIVTTRWWYVRAANNVFDGERVDSVATGVPYSPYIPRYPNAQRSSWEELAACAGLTTCTYQPVVAGAVVVQAILGSGRVLAARNTGASGAHVKITVDSTTLTYGDTTVFRVTAPGASQWAVTGFSFVPVAVGSPGAVMAIRGTTPLRAARLASIPTAGSPSPRPAVMRIATGVEAEGATRVPLGRRAHFLDAAVACDEANSPVCYDDPLETGYEIVTAVVDGAVQRDSVLVTVVPGLTVSCSPSAPIRRTQVHCIVTMSDSSSFTLRRLRSTTAGLVIIDSVLSLPTVQTSFDWTGPAILSTRVEVFGTSRGADLHAETDFDITPDTTFKDSILPDPPVQISAHGRPILLTDYPGIDRMGAQKGGLGRTMHLYPDYQLSVVPRGPNRRIAYADWYKWTWGIPARGEAAVRAGTYLSAALFPEDPFYRLQTGGRTRSGEVYCAAADMEQLRREIHDHETLHYRESARLRREFALPSYYERTFLQVTEDSVTQRTERSFYLRSVAYMRELTASDDRIDEPELTTSLTCTMRLP